MDPSRVQVRAKVDQEDLAHLSIARNSSVRLDAYPNLAFAAKLEERGPAAEATRPYAVKSTAIAWTPL